LKVKRETAVDYSWRKSKPPGWTCDGVQCRKVRKARCQVIHLEKTLSQKIETAIAQTMNAEWVSSWEHALHIAPIQHPPYKCAHNTCN
jgi:hypothetical protein